MELSVVEALAQAENLFRAGRLEEMDRLCSTLLESAPSVAEAHRFLGLSAYTRGRFAEATHHARQALALDPANAPAHDNLSLFLLAQGRAVQAEASAWQAVGLQPSLANAWHNLALALQRQGRFAEAEPPLRQAIALAPDQPNFWNNLATVLEHLERRSEAVAALERVLRLRPDFGPARQTLERLRALPLASPAQAAAENDRGVRLLAQSRYAEAEAAFRQVLCLAPDLPEIAFNLAQALQGQQQLGEAEKFFLRAVTLRPEWVEAHFDLAWVYVGLHRSSDAEASYRRALSLESEQAAAGKSRVPHILNNFCAYVLNNEGRIDEARAGYHQALAMQPDHAICRSNFLFNEQYAPGVTLAGLAQAHADYERQHAAPLRSTWRPFAQTPDPERPLRVGFVSGDLRHHPVGIFLAPVLERLDRKQWFTVCYANQDRNDHLTRRLTGLAGLWRVASNLSDEALAEQVRGDSIDLLIDLSGHTGRNRLLTFARKPAPVQLTWAGYVGTTGLSAIDYLIADRFHVPPGWEKHYSEQVLRLPNGYICYQPPAYAPPVGPLPALASGRVTFGSFNNIAKINPQVVALWSDILKRVPTSRLVLKFHWLDDVGLRQRLTDLFQAEGIAAQRLELLGSTSHAEQLQQYNRIDLALDTFPYSGGLTTLEACWMGVPVLTCPGETFASRHSFSHLSNLGLTETIARDQAEYVARAVSLAGDLGHLADLRAGLRLRMTQSPLCDLDSFTTHFATALRQVWRHWRPTK